MNVQRYHLSFLMAAALTATVLTACTADDFEAAREESISYSASVTAISTTRGSQTTLATMESFGVSAAHHLAGTSYSTAGCGSYFRNIEVDTESGESSYLWPSSDYRLSFYAYAPYGNANITLASADTPGRMQYTYTVPSAVASQVDMLTAEALDIDCPMTTPVELSFGHRLSDFKFYIDNSLPVAVTVNSLTIRNFLPTGTLTGTTWVPSGSATSFTLTSGAEIASGGNINLTGTDKHFFLIPQTLTAGTRMLDLFVTTEGGEDKHYYYDLTAAFTAEAGMSYLFTLRLTSKLEVDEGSGIDDWILLVGYVNHATGTEADDWGAELQPVERSTNGGITDWKRQN